MDAGHELTLHSVLIRVRSPVQAHATIPELTGRLIAASLDEHRGAKAGMELVERLLMRVATFGLSVASFCL